MLFRSTDGTTPHAIYNGQDLGPIDSFEIALSENHVAYRQGGYVIKDGQKIREAKGIQLYYPQLFLRGDNLAFVQLIGGEAHVIYNNQDLGDIKQYRVEGVAPYVLSVNENHIAFERIVSGKDHIIYDGKDLGEGNNPILSDDHIIFTRSVNSKWHVMYDGKDLGEGTPLKAWADNLVFANKSGNYFFGDIAFRQELTAQQHRPKRPQTFHIGGGRFQSG